MSVLTRFLNWVYGTTPSAPKVTPTLLAAPSAKKPAKKSAPKAPKKKTTKKVSRK